MPSAPFQAFQTGDFHTEVQQSPDFNNLSTPGQTFIGEYFKNQSHFTFEKYPGPKLVIEELKRAKEKLASEPEQQFFENQLSRAVLTLNQSVDWLAWIIKFRSYFDVQFLPKAKFDSDDLLTATDAVWFNHSVHSTINRYPDYNKEQVLVAIEDEVDIFLESISGKPTLSSKAKKQLERFKALKKFLLKYRKVGNQRINKQFEDWKNENPDTYSAARKYYHTFEDWLSGNQHWIVDGRNSELPIFFEEDGKMAIHILEPEEYDRILAKKKEIFEDHVAANLEWYKQDFEKRYAESLEKEELISAKLMELEQILKEKDYRSFKIYFNKGASTWVCTADYRENEAFKNEIAFWYRNTIVDPRFLTYARIKPEDDKSYHRFIPEVAMMVFYKLLNFVKNHKHKIEGEPAQEPMFQTQRQIALYYRYLSVAGKSEPITVNNRDKIALRLGYSSTTSGQKIYDRFNSLNNSTQRTAKGKYTIRDLKKVIELLEGYPEAQSLAKDELKIAESYI